MKEQYFQTFYDALVNATEKIGDKYFRLPVAYDEEYVFRERAYCYELYHQIREILPEDFPYILSGEVNKAGHPLIAEKCGGIILLLSTIYHTLDLHTIFRDLHTAFCVILSTFAMVTFIILK